MQECWLPEPTSRPNCEYLVVRLGQMLSCLVDSPEVNPRMSRIDKIVPRKYVLAFHLFFHYTRYFKVLSILIQFTIPWNGNIKSFKANKIV